jgi:hypothetical protein
MHQTFVPVPAKVLKPQPKINLQADLVQKKLVPVPQLPTFELKWDTTTSHRDKFTIQNSTITMVSDGRLWYQLVASDPLKGPTTIKATIKKYGGIRSIVFGLLTESRRKYRYSGDKGHQ